MFSKGLSLTVVALAASGLVSAQTSSLCNPVKGDKCKPDDAAPDSLTIDFTKGASDFFDIAAGTKLSYDGGKGAVFSISKDTDAPTITSKEYIFFGRVDVWCQVAPGAGIVSSFVLQSDDLDEIDWEWLGADTAQAQTNYFSKGDTSTYDRGGFSPVSNPQSQVYKYSIDWTSSSLTWLINDNPVRVLNYNDAKGGSTYPQTPMQIKLGTWVAGRSGAPEGTINWAGGLANFANGPFNAYFKQINVVNYNNGVKGATSYVYGDTSGTMGSIIVKTDGSKQVSSTTSAISSTSTTTSSKTTMSTLTTTSANVTTTRTSTTATNLAATTSATKPTSTSAPNAAGTLASSLSNVALIGAAVVIGVFAL